MSWSQPHKIRVLFAVATLIPVGVLAWLGVRILNQERDVERQRAREGLEVSAGRLAIGMDRRLADIEEQLARGEGIRFTTNGIEPTAGFRLLYQPQSFSNADDPLPPTFATAEAEEFQKQNWTSAAAAYEKLAGSTKPRLRAAALVRLARVLRKRGDTQAALHAYDTLKQLGSTPVGGEPAELLARQGRARIFENAGLVEQLHLEAAAIAKILSDGELPIDRATFGFYTDFLRQWDAPLPPVEAVARTEAAVELWQQWRNGQLPPRGRRILREGKTAVLALWEQSVAWIGAPNDLQTLFSPLADTQRLKFSAFDLDGQLLFGIAESAGVSLTPGDTRLPFILKVTALDAPPSQAGTVLVSGLILALLVMSVAAVALYRVTTRELLLARQQSDFVSAVSHEFRTPLTSMRHLTDLLVSRGITSEERKTQYYELLAHETERLHRMVESLLSFGRIEAGAYAWQLEPADVGELTRGIVEEFRREPDAAGREIISDIAVPSPVARVDRESLSRALWNLVENAAKYSERGTSIRVFVRRHDASLLLGVEDQGAGIAFSEQTKIFQKFVRGAGAKREGIRGVGIGLALVQRIVEAHGGSVRVESEPGRGSTFTLVIPCLES